MPGRMPEYVAVSITRSRVIKKCFFKKDLVPPAVFVKRRFFPTCQGRVAKFHHTCCLLLLVLFLVLPSSSSSSSFSSPATELSGHYCYRASSLNTAGPQWPDKMPKYMPIKMPEFMPNRMPEYMSDRLLVCQIECQSICQIECQNICQIDC